MTNNENFIDEVSEAVRQDKLFKYFKDYGWIAGVCIAGLVGWAGYAEYAVNQAEAQARSRGDAVLQALDSDDAGSRLNALATLPKNPVIDMLISAAALEAQDTEQAISAYESIANLIDISNAYRQIALFKAELLKSANRSPQDSIQAFEVFNVAGNPYRLFALEQIAVFQLSTGDSQAAEITLSTMQGDATLSQAMAQRVADLQRFAAKGT